MADNTHRTHATHDRAKSATAATAYVPFSTAASALRAADTIEQDAIAWGLAADKERAAAKAAKAAAEAKKAAEAKAAAKAQARARAAQAARERAAAARAASRSAQRAPLAAPTASATAAPTASVSVSATASPGKVGSLIAFLKSQLGKPYVYGATGPGSYDCSGLTQAAFASVGVTLPRTSQEQSAAGTSVSLGSLQAGDLVFWGGRGSAYHVGVYIGDGQYLDAANPSTPVGIHPLTYSMPDGAVRLL